MTGSKKKETHHARSGRHSPADAVRNAVVAAAERSARQPGLLRGGPGLCLRLRAGRQYPVAGPTRQRPGRGHRFWRAVGALARAAAVPAAGTQWRARRDHCPHPPAFPAAARATAGPAAGRVALCGSHQRLWRQRAGGSAPATGAGPRTAAGRHTGPAQPDQRAPGRTGRGHHGRRPAGRARRERRGHRLATAFCPAAGAVRTADAVRGRSRGWHIQHQIT